MCAGSAAPWLQAAFARYDRICATLTRHFTLREKKVGAGSNVRIGCRRKQKLSSLSGVFRIYTSISRKGHRVRKPGGVQGQSPGRGPAEAEAFL